MCRFQVGSAKTRPRKTAQNAVEDKELGRMGLFGRFLTQINQGRGSDKMCAERHRPPPQFIGVESGSPATPA